MYTSRFMKAAGYLTAVIALTAVISSAARAQAKAEDYPAPKPAFAGADDVPPQRNRRRRSKSKLSSSTSTQHGRRLPPNGKMLVSERYGFLRVAEMNGFYAAPIANVPDVKIVAAQGLHDVVVDPDFAQNSMMYFTYFAPPPGEDARRLAHRISFTPTFGKFGLRTPHHARGEERLARARLSDDERASKMSKCFSTASTAASPGRRTAPSSSPAPTASALRCALRWHRSRHLRSRHSPQFFGTRRTHRRRSRSITKDNPCLHQPRRPLRYLFARPSRSRRRRHQSHHRRTLGHRSWPARRRQDQHYPPREDYGWPDVSYGRRYNGDLVAGKGLTQAPGVEQPVDPGIPISHPAD